LRFSVINFGCKVNQYQGELLRETLISYNLDESSARDADLIFVNGCLVTETARIEALRTARKFSKFARVILTGCSGAEKQNDFENLPPDKLEILDQLIGIKGKIQDTIYEFSGHTRAMVLVQLGCNNFCTYCIVPYMRGEPKDRNMDLIIEEVQNLGKNGFKEIVLCGTELGHNKNLVKLIEEIGKIESIKRIRLSSINPRHLTPELVKQILSLPKVASHLHLPLQSGSDRVLELMERGYDSTHFLNLCESAREYDKNVGITTDILVGFPGETEDDFEETLKTIKQARFSRCHVFPFSARPGTKAYEMTPIPPEIAKKRASIARGVASYLARETISDIIGSCAWVLVEQENEGFSGNYLRVKIIDGAGTGDFVKCEIVDAQGQILLGRKKS
jgi:threonylcarbamoyladenosine tRNA methylthiotransferase MtaB